MAELILVYGGTGSFKTAQLLFLAKYAYKRWGKRTRLASCDGGGWKPLEPACDAGLIQAWGISSLENPRSVLRKVSQGFWPRLIGIPPKLVLAQDMKELVDKIAVEALEGLTSVSNIIMRDALNKQLIVAGDQRGEKGAIQFDEKIQVAGLDGKELTQTEKYSFATQGNYNDAQRAAFDFCTNLRSLPIPLVYLTALEARGEEEDTRKTIIGPAVIGKAMTAQVGAWVGDQIHAEDYFVEEDDPSDKPPTGVDPKVYKRRKKQITKARYWFIRHPDPVTGMLFPAKPRVSPDQIPRLLEVYPGGYFEPTPDAGIDVYLEVVDKLQAAASGGLREWMKAQDELREAAAKVGGTDAPKADLALVKATVTGQVERVPVPSGAAIK
jgi:hypothetical protein